MWRHSFKRIPPNGFCPVGLNHAEGPPAYFVVASGGGLSEGHGHDGPCVCLGDGQTEAKRVQSQGERGHVLYKYGYEPIPDLVLVRPVWIIRKTSSLTKL